MTFLLKRTDWLIIAGVKYQQDATLLVEVSEDLPVHVWQIVTSVETKILDIVVAITPSRLTLIICDDL